MQFIRGVSMSDIERLASFKIPHLDNNEKKEKNTCSIELAKKLLKTTCPVCLENFKEGDFVITLPCLHRFHKTPCMTKWLQMKAICPVCQNKPFE